MLSYKDSDKNNTTVTAEDSKKNNTTVTIGIIAPLSGSLAVAGKRAVDGISLAINEFDQNSPIEVLLKVEDSKGEPKQGINAFNKLVLVDKVRLILGDLTSGVTLAIAPLAEANHVIVLAPGASNPAVRDAGDYIFRNWVSDDFDGQVAAEFLVKQLKKTKIIILYIQNDFGVGLKDAFKNTLLRLGGSVIREEGFQANQTQFRALATKISRMQYDAIYLAGQPREMGYLLRQMKELAMNPLIFSNVSVEEADFRKIAAKSAGGIYYTTPAFDLNSTDKLVQSFVARYREDFHDEPDIVSAIAYDAAKMLLACLQPDRVEPSVIKNCLYNMKNFHGVTGDASFDSHGDVVKNVIVKHLDKSGTLRIISEFIPSPK